MTIPGDRVVSVGEASSAPPGRTGIVLRDALPWEDLRELAETAEDCGYEALFVPEISGREAFTTLTGLASATEGLRLGTGVVTMQSRTPVVTAMAAATLHDVSSGRAILGLGAGDPRRGAAGATRQDRPIELMRAYTLAVRAALSGEAVALEDDVFRVNGFRSSLAVEGPRPPIWLAALGDRMIRTAGEVADGILLNWCTPERVAAARVTLAEAAEQAGRDPASLTIAVYVRACLGVPDEVALPPLREMAGTYASYPSYLAQFERMGLGDVARAAAAAHRADRRNNVPESFVRALLITGGRKGALGRFAEYRQAGADLVLCYPVAARDPFSSVMGTLMAAAPDPAIER